MATTTLHVRYLRSMIGCLILAPRIRLSILQCLASLLRPIHWPPNPAIQCTARWLVTASSSQAGRAGLSPLCDAGSGKGEVESPSRSGRNAVLLAGKGGWARVHELTLLTAHIRERQPSKPLESFGHGWRFLSGREGRRKGASGWHGIDDLECTASKRSQRPS